MNLEMERLWPGGPFFAQDDQIRLTTDTVLLADFAQSSAGRSGVDLGCASGALMLLLLWKTPALTMTGMELTDRAAALAKENPEAHAEAELMALWKALLLVLVSFLAMVFGANILVEGATNIARLLGVTDRVIGLTIVAIGTSLPELFSSVMAAVKGKTDMAIGNIIGSGSFNILCVIGVSSIITPIIGTNIGFAFDYALMIFMGVLLWLFLRSKHELERWEGVILTIIFIAYLTKTVVVG